MILLQLRYVFYLIVSTEKIFLNECLPKKQHLYLNALKVQDHKFFFSEHRVVLVTEL
jgi:hypothetical protein